MPDVWMEVFRALVAGWLVLILLKARSSRQISAVVGWRFLLAGFLLLFFGSVIDVTDNFPSLNRFVVIGDTETEAFLEKVVGYLLGYVLLAVGVWRWLPRLAELHDLTHQRLEVQKERVKVLHATMRTVQDIVNNGLNNLQLVRMEAEEKKALDPETLSLMDEIILETSSKLNKLGSLESVSEVEMAIGTGVDGGQGDSG
ncbi:MAG: hypothetical protein ACE5H3_10735 [Planctomycetota bacterium]